MIEVRDANGQKHYLSADAIAQVSETGASSHWHGIRSIVKLFDGTKIEANDTAESIVNAIAGTRR